MTLYQQSPHILPTKYTFKRGRDVVKGTRLVPCRIDVDEKWDHKVRGIHVGSSLGGCGDYVDFVPRNLPHIVCPTIAQ